MTAVDERRSWLPFPRPPLAPHLVLQRAHRDRSLPPLVRALAAVHSGSPGAVPLATDLVVLVAVAVAGLGAQGWVLAATAFGALVGSGRVYRDRDRVVARGLAWWPGALVGPMAVGVLAHLLLTGDGPARTAATAVA
ncbi:MAG: hypothetical protein ACXVEC_15375, partial [Nocardioides sp.]